MGLGSCQCTYLGFWYDPASSFITALELFVICLIGVMGFMVNFKFRKKLKEEKRKRAPGRKGNVIEPLMSWYCLILMFGIPYCQLLHWQFVNEVIPFHLIPEWLCILLTTLERCIVFCVVYNSLFVALIRYVYIVHQQKSNEWDFQRVGKQFQFASILIPVGMEILHLYTNSNAIHLTKNTIDMGKEKIESCNYLLNGINSTFESQKSFQPEPLDPNPFSQKMALIGYYLYVVISALVSLNVMEGFLYLRIFRCIER